MRFSLRQPGPPQAALHFAPRIDRPSGSDSLQRLLLSGPASDLDAQRLSLLLAGCHSLTLAHLILELWSTPERVEFAICCDGRQVLPLTRVIRGIFPEWQVTPAAMLPAPVGRFDVIGQLQSRHPEALPPLPSIQSFGQHDPLSSIVAIEPEDEESLLIRLFSSSASAEQLTKARQQLTVSAPATHWSDVLADALGAGGRVPRFEPKLQKALEQRLSLPMFQMFGVVVISGSNLDKLNSLKHSVEAAFAARFGLQMACWVHSDGIATAKNQKSKIQPMLCSTEEIAALWHLPGKSVVNPRISRLRWQATSLPKEVVSSDGMLLGLHRQQGQVLPVHLSFHDGQQGPIALLGRTGYGKSELLKMLLHCQAQRGDRPSLYLIDPNGKLAQEVVLQCVPDWRIDDTYLIEFGNSDWVPKIALFSPPKGASEEQIVQFVESTVSLLQLIFEKANLTPRMEDVLFALVATLARIPESTLLDATKLFSSRTYRSRVLARLTDVAILEFWAEYDMLSDVAQREMVAPVLRRLRQFYRSPSLRNIFAQVSGTDSTQAPGHLIIANSLVGSAIASGADFIGEILIARAQMSAQAKMENISKAMHPTVFAVDESQRYSGAALPMLLREARKTNITTILATQYIDAWGEGLVKSIVGNIGTLACFSISSDDVRKLAGSLAPFTSEQIQSLNRYEAIIRMQKDGQTLQAFDVQTVMVENTKTDKEAEQLLDCIRSKTRQRFTRPKAEVEAEIAQRYRPYLAAALDESDERLPTEDIYED